jgi:hypothetical protein
MDDVRAATILLPFPSKIIDLMALTSAMKLALGVVFNSIVDSGLTATKDVNCSLHAAHPSTDV